MREDRLFPLYVLTLSCGLRRGEVLALHWEDVNLDKKVLHVRYSLQQLKGKGLVITEVKNESSRRTVSIPDFAVEVLKPLQGEGLVFQTSNSTPIGPRNLVRHFKASLEKAGLPDMRFHDLRHTTATLLLTSDVHPKVVQSILGHSQISTTLDIYSHVVPGLKEKAADKLDEILRI